MANARVKKTPYASLASEHGRLSDAKGIVTVFARNAGGYQFYSSSFVKTTEDDDKYSVYFDIQFAKKYKEKVDLESAFVSDKAIVNVKDGFWTVNHSEWTDKKSKKTMERDNLMLVIIDADIYDADTGLEVEL